MRSFMELAVSRFTGDDGAGEGRAGTGGVSSAVTWRSIWSYDWKSGELELSSGRIFFIELAFSLWDTLALSSI